MQFREALIVSAAAGYVAAAVSYFMIGYAIARLDRDWDRAGVGLRLRLLLIAAAMGLVWPASLAWSVLIALAHPTVAKGVRDEQN